MSDKCLYCDPDWIGKFKQKMTELGVTVEGDKFSNLKCNIDKIHIIPKGISLDHFFVYCSLPLDVAKEMCSWENGNEFTNITCLSGCLANDVKYLDEEGKILIELGHKDIYEKSSRKNIYRFVDNPQSTGKPFISHLEISSMEGMKLFTDTLKKHSLL